MATNLDTLQMVADLPQPSVLFCVARVPGSQRLFVGSSDFKVSEIDLAQPKPQLKSFGSHTSYVTGIALAGKVVVSGSYDGRLLWWDADTKASIRTTEAHAKWIRGVFASRDGKLVASVADDMVCRVWDASSGKLVHELKGHQEQTPHHFPSMLYAAAFSADGTFLATGDKVGHVVIWETATGKPAATLEVPGMYTWDPTARRHSIGGIRSLAFSPDGNLLAVGGMGQVGNIDHLEGKTRVEVFDWRKSQRTHEFAGDKFNGLVNHVEFHPQSAWLCGAGGANDGFMLFFDLNTKKVLRQDKVPMHVHDAVLTDAADGVILVGHNKIQVWAMKG
jgi:WD40 repeat protein